MTVAKPLRDDTVAAAGRSYEWLRANAALASAVAPHGLDRAIEWVITAWLCEQAFGLGVNSSLSLEGILQVGLRLNTLGPSQAYRELLTCDALRVTLANGIASRHGVTCDGLTVFVSGLVASLPPQTENATDGDDLLETRLLVALAGLASMPSLPCLDMLIDGTALDLLQADESTTDRVAGHVIAASAHGTREPMVSARLRWRLIDAMSVWLLDFARGYRLGNVALMMRSLRCLGETSVVHDAMRFLLGQHHPRGYFGFFGPEARRAKRLSPGWNEAASLQLPVTLACLWALSECSDHDFQLLGTTALPVRTRCHVG